MKKSNFEKNLNICVKLVFMRNSAWTDYFSTGIQYLYQGGNQSISISMYSVYILECAFSKIASTSIYYTRTSDSTCFLLEDSTFYYCHSNNYGGCLYYYPYGQCVQHRVVNEGSFTPTNGQHAYVFATKNQNYVQSSTFNLCGSSTSQYNILLLEYGNIMLTDLNITNSYCVGRVCYEFGNTLSDSYLKYSNVRNNSRNNHYSLTFHGAGAGFSCYVEYMNIIENAGPQSIYGLMYSSNNAYIIYNNYISNDVPIYFNADEGSTMYVIKCYFDSSTTNGSVIFEESQSETLDISSLIAALRTPAQTPETTPISTPSYTIAATPQTTPIKTPSSTPKTTPSSTPATTPSSTPEKTPSTTPSSTPKTTPSITPSTTPKTTPSSTPGTTPINTPSSTPKNTPSITPSSTPYSTPSSSPIYTPEITPSNTATLIDVVAASATTEQETNEERPNSQTRDLIFLGIFFGNDLI